MSDAVAIDCEMVDVYGGKALAKVSVVSSSYTVLYDQYVKPRQPVVNYHTHVSGVTEGHLRYAKSFVTAQREVSNLLRGKIVVGHDLRQDFDALGIPVSSAYPRDTMVFFRDRKGYRNPNLKNLAMQELRKSIQQGKHDSVEDAVTAMQLYNKYKNECW